MDTINWLFTFLTEQIAAAFWAVAMRGLLFALAGLALGIFLVMALRRGGAFHRESRWWSYLAKLHYLLIPILLMIFSGIIGGINGAHRVSKEYIDRAAQPLVEYGCKYVAQFAQFIPEIPLEESMDISLEDVIALHAVEQGGVKPGSLKYDLASMINRAIISTTLDELGIPAELRNPSTIVRALNATQVTQQHLMELPVAVHRYSDSYFYAQYLLIWGLFLPLFLLLLAEFALHLVVRWLGRASKRR
jgi:hypothetical protein